MSEAVKTTAMFETDNWCKAATISFSSALDTSGYRTLLIDDDVGYADYAQLDLNENVVIEFSSGKQLNMIQLFFTPHSSIFDTLIVPKTSTVALTLEYKDSGGSWNPVTEADGWEDFNYRFGLSQRCYITDYWRVDDCGIFSLYNSTDPTIYGIRITMAQTHYLTEVRLLKTVEIDAINCRLRGRREFDGTIRSVQGELTFHDTNFAYLPSSDVISVKDKVWLKYEHENQIYYYGGLEVSGFEEDIGTRVCTVDLTDRFWKMSDKKINIDTSAYVDTDMRQPLEDLLSAGGIHKDLVTMPALPVSTYIPRNDYIKSEVDRLLGSLGDVQLLQEKEGTVRIINRNAAYFDETSYGGSYWNTYTLVPPVDKWVDILFNEEIINKRFTYFRNPAAAWSFETEPLSATSVLDSFDQLSILSMDEKTTDADSEPKIKLKFYQILGTFKISVDAFRHFNGGSVELQGSVNTSFDVTGGEAYTEYDITLSQETSGAYTHKVVIEKYSNWHLTPALVSTTTLRFTMTQNNPNMMWATIEMTNKTSTSNLYKLFTAECYASDADYPTSTAGGYGTHDYPISVGEWSKIQAVVIATAQSPLVSAWRDFAMIDVQFCEWDNDLNQRVGDWKDYVDDLVYTGTGYINVRVTYSFCDGMVKFPIYVYFTKTDTSNMQSKSKCIYVKNLRYKAALNYGSDSVIYNDLFVQTNQWSLESSASELTTSDESHSLGVGNVISREYYHDDAASISSIYLKVTIDGVEYTMPSGATNDEYVEPTTAVRLVRVRGYVGTTLKIYNDQVGGTARTITKVSVYGNKYVANSERINEREATSIETYGKITKDIDNDLISTRTEPYVASKFFSFSRTPVIVPNVVTTKLNLDIDFDTVVCILDDLNGILLRCDLYEIEHIIDGIGLNHETNILGKVFEFEDIHGNNYYTMKVPLWDGTLDTFASEAEEGEYARVTLTAAQGGGTQDFVKINGVARIISQDLSDKETTNIRQKIATWYDDMNGWFTGAENGGMRLATAPGTPEKNWFVKIDNEPLIFA